MRKTAAPPSPQNPSADAGGSEPISPFTSSREHLLAEFSRIDALIRVRVLGGLRDALDKDPQGPSPAADISAAILRPLGQPHWTERPLSPEAIATSQSMMAVSALRRAESARLGIPLRLVSLARAFDLSRFDIDVLLLGLSAELDLRYERFFAFLYDDESRRRPGVDLAVGLLCDSLELRMKSRERFLPDAPLLRNDLIHLFTEPAQLHPPLLGCSFKVDDRIVSHLYDIDAIDARLSPYARLITPEVKLADLLLKPDLKERLAALAEDKEALQRGHVLHLRGPYGVGKRAAAEALCQAAGKRLLVVDGAELAAAPPEVATTLLRLAARECRLLDAALYWDGLDPLLTDEKRGPRGALLNAIEDLKGLCFLAGEATFVPANFWRGQRLIRIEIGLPASSDRALLWSRALGDQVTLAPEVDLAAFADRYRLSAGQIHDAATTARGSAELRDPARRRVTLSDLSDASALHANRSLSDLATRIEARGSWDDLVLAKDKKDRLREICNRARYRSLVLDGWGFEQKLLSGKGVSLLFKGPPGTGKTMAAGVIARELGLDLYQIDLSRVVSKYIGETEKQLARIFAEAERSQAILFFDEADALFGKRSEVKDAHDRYANIETSYLLQRMEMYEGIAVLASNYSQNMDDAFVRRIQFIVEFTLPNERERLTIWEQIWPPDVPRAPDLDLAHMARRFDVAGGNIRNIVLAAAFLAASEGAEVSQRHLLKATRREYNKIGKMVNEELFAYKAPE